MANRAPRTSPVTFNCKVIPPSHSTAVRSAAACFATCLNCSTPQGAVRFQAILREAQVRLKSTSTQRPVWTSDFLVRAAEQAYSCDNVQQLYMCSVCPCSRHGQMTDKARQSRKRRPASMCCKTKHWHSPEAVFCAARKVGRCKVELLRPTHLCAVRPNSSTCMCVYVNVHIYINTFLKTCCSIYICA